jgi:seryl-tRNA synthetase
MIDRTLFKDQPEKIIAALHKKDPRFDAQTMISLDQRIRQLRLDVESLRHKKNELAALGKKGVTDQLRQDSIANSKEMKEKEQELQTIEADFNTLYLSCPNLPEEDIPVGGKESNKVVKTVKEKPVFSFVPKNHVELAQALGWIDFVTPVKLAGNNFVLYKNQGVSLLYSLVFFMIKNNLKHGFQLVAPPYVVNEQSLVVAGNFPKFKDDVYAIANDNLYLIPTAEVSLANVYRDAILAGKELPIRMTAWTGCFRKEAGGYGAQERGLIRIHQFEKVELFTLCEPAQSAGEQERMLACAEEILQKLGLHYRISLLAGQDCSFASAKTYDIEVWLPGQNSYYEVSSISNCTDFQARRGLIRYKKNPESKTELVHTLNGSSLALSRLMVALLETYQQADGSIEIPDVLKKEGFWLDA